MPKELTGPDALGALANAAEGKGLPIDADNFERLEKQWRADRQYIEVLETQLADQGQPIPDRAMPKHAVTPTDRRH